MRSLQLPKDNVAKWLESLIKTGDRVVAPVRAGEELLFSTVTDVGEISLDDGLTTKSGKGVFFPQSEPILSYKTEDGKQRIEDIDDFAPATILLGVRPCDAAAMDILDAVFGWDYNDSFYLKRRENTTIVSVACGEPVDEFCFCTSVGLAPDSRLGSDIVLMKDANGNIAIETLTEKGDALIDKTNAAAEAPPAEVSTADVPVLFDLEKIKPWLDEHFEDEFWQEMSLKCVGCGTCTFLCPTCHCFDIVDETRLSEGVRLKNWDSCQFGLFTLHASGHNPRAKQSERYRQRIMHKFKYYVEKFDKTLCVGCGRCIRSCPVGHRLLDYLNEISSRDE